MLLVIDIGNTNTVLGVYEGETLQYNWRLETKTQQSADEYGILARNLFTLSGLDPTKISDIVIALDDMDHDRILKLISIINGAPISIKIVPDLYEVISGLARTEQISGLPLIEVNFQESKWSSSGMKRASDFLLSTITLLVFSPLFILIGIIIKINSKGPIIYSQKRLGYRGRPYNIYKFRSMVADAEEKSGPVWTLDDDPRITSIGKILRKYRIDELPQFINVFFGQMSIIGPRPERPYFIEKLKEKFPLYERRFRVRPGITGWSQIKHPSDTKEEDCLLYTSPSPRDRG